MVEFRRKFCLFPKHDGKGGIVVEYQDGKSETLSLMDGLNQRRGWEQATDAAAVYLAIEKTMQESRKMLEKSTEKEPSNA